MCNNFYLIFLSLSKSTTLKFLPSALIIPWFLNIVRALINVSDAIPAALAKSLLGIFIVPPGLWLKFSTNLIMDAGGQPWTVQQKY